MKTKIFFFLFLCCISIFGIVINGFSFSDFESDDCFGDFSYGSIKSDFGIDDYNGFESGKIENEFDLEENDFNIMYEKKPIPEKFSDFELEEEYDNKFQHDISTGDFTSNSPRNGFNFKAASDFGEDDWDSDFSQEDSWDSDFGEDSWDSDFSDGSYWESDFEESDEGFSEEETGDYFDWYDDYSSDEFGDEFGNDFPEGHIFDKERNNPPVILSEPVTVAYVGEEYHYQVVAYDPDGDELTYKLDHAPEGMTIDAESGLIKWIPTAEGEYYVRVVVTDDNWGLDAQDFVIRVIGQEEPPEPEPEQPEHEEEPALVLGNLYVDRIYLLDIVKAGDVFEIGFKLENTGSKELDDVSVLVLIPELGIGRRIGPFDLKGHEEITKWAFIDIPKGVEGEFAIRLSFSNDNLRRTIFRDVIIKE